MSISQTSVNSGVPIWQTGKSPETAQGGFTLDPGNYSDGDVIPAGSPMGFDETTRKASKVVIAVLTAAAGTTDTTYKVAKGAGLIIGTKLGASVGGTAYAVTAIDTSNADYDSVTLGTTLGVALAAGTALFESSATGATAAVLATTPKGLLYSDVTVGGNADVAIVLRGTVYANRIGAIPADVKKALPATILFSQSY